MTAVIESVPLLTHQTASGKDRDKFLRKVLREDGWTIVARRSEDWKLVFQKTIRSVVGEPDVSVSVRIDDAVSVRGKYGNVQSFSDSDVVFVPPPNYVRLTYGSVHTVAKMLLEGCSLCILGSSGSTNSSKHGLAFLSLECSVKGCNDSVIIGHQSVYVRGKMIICGSVEA